MRYHQTHVKMAINKRSINKECWRRYREKGTLYIVDGNMVVQPLWRTEERFLPLKTKNKVTIQFHNSTPGDISRQNFIQGFQRIHAQKCSLYTLFTTAKTWKQPKHPSTRGMDKDVIYINRILTES